MSDIFSISLFPIIGLTSIFIKLQLSDVWFNNWSIGCNFDFKLFYIMGEMSPRLMLMAFKGEIFYWFEEVVLINEFTGFGDIFRLLVLFPDLGVIYFFLIISCDFSIFSSSSLFLINLYTVRFHR